MTELATLEAGQSIRALTAQDLMNRVDRIREVQARVMKDGVDYGLIPGCGDKPTLFKAGAETLLLTFEMAALPDQLSIADLGDSDEVRYRVIVPIVHVPTGRLCGNGVGEASSLEEKYKWRKAVCDAEFEASDPDRRRLKYFRDGNTVNQVRTNKADVSNTVLKMAKKRALVDGALTTTAASRVFGQDFEDLPEEMRNGDGNGQKKAAPKTKPSNEMCLPNYGPDAGKPFSEASIEHLRDYLAGAERSILDEKKARFLKQNTAMRDALKVHITERERPIKGPEQATQQPQETTSGPLSIDDACFRLEGVQNPKEFADLMNQAMASDYTPEERKRLQDNAAQAKKRLGIK